MLNFSNQLIDYNNACRLIYQLTANRFINVSLLLLLGAALNLSITYVLASGCRMNKTCYLMHLCMFYGFLAVHVHAFACITGRVSAVKSAPAHAPVFNMHLTYILGE